jgi:hypothetical protein
MYRGAALIAALLAVSGCGIDPVSPKETRVDYAGFVTSADQAAIYANAQCAEINRLAVFKVEDVVDGRKGATFQCLPVPKCYPQEAAAPGQPVALTPAMPVAAPVGAARPGQAYVPGQPYVVPASASARLPGPIVAMAPVSSTRDRRGARKSSQSSIDNQADDTYIPFAARPVAAGPQPQPIPSFEAINIPTGPDPVSAEAPGPQPAGSFATAAAPSWQQAVTCKPNATLPLAIDHLPTGDAYPF